MAVSTGAWHVQSRLHADSMSMRNLAALSELNKLSAHKHELDGHPTHQHMDCPLEYRRARPFHACCRPPSRPDC